ncbi:MAG: OmpA family protein, partial [Candidatus Aminicenantes bacterium]
MKKILIIILIFCIGLIGISVRGHSESETDFALLLKGEKIISTGGSYETGKSDFNPDFASFLNKLGDFLKENQGLIIEVGGHTDNSGSPEVNQKLSLSRAQQVKEYLVRKLGIDEDRILVKGYSSRFPIADNSTPKGKAMNRRIEIAALKNVNPAGRLTYLRRDVFTKLPDKIDFIRATINQDLYHLYRVLTRKKSNANVTFLDLSKINLGPQSLMIIYSLLERGFRLPRKQNVHLLTGGLRTKLNELKGRLQVETPSCLISSHSVEILVGIDEKKMSALSVFDGKSEVKAQEKKVEVPEGFGTTVEMGKPPGPPEPLLKAPQLIKPIESKTNLPGKPNTSKVS